MDSTSLIDWFAYRSVLFEKSIELSENKIRSNRYIFCTRVTILQENLSSHKDLCTRLATISGEWCGKVTAEPS